MAVLPQSFFSLMSIHFTPFSFLPARHVGNINGLGSILLYVVLYLGDECLRRFKRGYEMLGNDNRCVF